MHSPDGGQTQENVCEGFEGQAGEPVNLSSLCIVISFHNGYNIQTHQEMNENAGIKELKEHATSQKQ